MEPVFLVSVLTASAEETYERFHEFLKPDGILRKLTGKKQDATGVLYGFAKIVYREDRESIWDYLRGNEQPCERPSGVSVDS